jgi:hypothetical protein
MRFGDCLKLSALQNGVFDVCFCVSSKPRWRLKTRNSYISAELERSPSNLIKPFWILMHHDESSRVTPITWVKPLEPGVYLLQIVRYNYFRFGGRHLVFRVSIDIGGCRRWLSRVGRLRKPGSSRWDRVAICCRTWDKITYCLAAVILCFGCRPMSGSDRLCSLHMG